MTHLVIEQIKIFFSGFEVHALHAIYQLFFFKGFKMYLFRLIGLDLRNQGSSLFALSFSRVFHIFVNQSRKLYKHTMTIDDYASGFFWPFQKNSSPKKLKQISQKLKDRPTLKTEYHLIFGHFFRKSVRSTFFGIFYR